MNLVETHDLLTLAAKYDNRRFDDATVVAWREILADVRFDDARTAVVAHFGATDAYLMPVHVVRGASEIDRDRRRRDRELREQREIEAYPATDRKAETDAILAGLRDRLPNPGSEILRRAEWLVADRRRDRVEEPNPSFVAVPPPGGHPAPTHDPEGGTR